MIGGAPSYGMRSLQIFWGLGGGCISVFERHFHSIVTFIGYYIRSFYILQQIKLFLIHDFLARRRFCRRPGDNQLFVDATPIRSNERVFLVGAYFYCMQAELVIFFSAPEDS